MPSTPASKAPGLSHVREGDVADRGTTTERGYGAEHQRLRKHYVGLLLAGEVLECWRCFEAITDPDDMHVGHDDHDRSITRGPEHRLCNLRAGADKANGRLVEERHPRSRSW